MVRSNGLGWLVAVAVMAACSSSPANGPDDALQLDAGVDGGADARAPDAGVAGDAMVDAPPGPTSPFPADPQGGEFAWVVSGSGAVAQNAVVDSAGNIVVVARQTDVVKLGPVVVPRPASGKSMVVLKLTADGTALWGHALAGHDFVSAHAIATTPAGDVIVGGEIAGATVFENDGFVAVLDGATGAERWSMAVASKYNDAVSGVAATSDAIYALGAFATDGEIAGHAVPAGGFLIRYDLDGAVRWVRSFAVAPRGNNALAFDPARGLVGVGNFAGDIALGGEPIAGSGSVVVGFDLDGGVRFARPVLSNEPAWSHNLAIAPTGDVYVASGTAGTEVVIDDHVIPYVDYPGHPYLLRLAADGQFVAATQVTGEKGETAIHVAADASGAAYMAMPCDGRIDVQPEISCVNGGAIVSYGPDNAYRWATRIQSAYIGAIAAAPGNRLFVVGEAPTAMTDFGGVVVPTQSLFIAALVGGPGRAPTTLPAKPALASAALDGVPDGQIRQGDTGTLVIRGAALDQVTSAKLGDLDVHIRAGAATADELRLLFMIPHGYPAGPLALTLGNLAGSASLPAVITVTPIVVAANGSEAGRGTYASPMTLCRQDDFYFARYGDVVLLQNGKHECKDSVSVRAGVTFRGESKAGAIVTGPNGSSSKFGGFFVGADADDPGVTTIENMTIASASYHAIDLYGSGDLAVTDVDIIGAYGSGVWVDGGGYARVTRYRYLQGQATAIVVGLNSGTSRVDATDITVEDAYRGILMDYGSVNVTRASISSSAPCIQAGSESSYAAAARLVQIADSTLRSNAGGFYGGLAEVEITGTSIAPLTTGYTYYGVQLYSGGLTMRDSQLSGWQSSAIRASYALTLAVPSISDSELGVTALLDNIDIWNSGTGLSYNAYATTDRVSVHGARINTRFDALSLYGPFTADLGTAAFPGDNELQAANGAALHDRRTTAGPAIDAHGTTLNGTALTGDILGPMTSNVLQISGPNTIRF